MVCASEPWPQDPWRTRRELPLRRTLLSFISPPRSSRDVVSVRHYNYKLVPLMGILVAWRRIKCGEDLGHSSHCLDHHIGVSFLMKEDWDSTGTAR
jgi:hypothetical protein